MPLYATLVVCLPAPILWLLTMFTSTQAAAWTLGRAAARLFLRAAFVPFSVHGLERLPRDAPCVIVCNMRATRTGSCWWPRCPAHSRLSSSASCKAASWSAVTLRAWERSSWNVPTSGLASRMRTGSPRRPRAAARARLPVVPVAIRGSRTLLPDGSWRLRRSSIAIEIGEPIPTPAAAGGLFAAAAQLRRSARAEIAHLLEGA